MEQTNVFRGSTLNVSPLCQGCDLIEFADEHNIMFHQCEICQNEYQNMEYKEQIECDYRTHENPDGG